MPSITQIAKKYMDLLPPSEDGSKEMPMPIFKVVNNLLSKWNGIAIWDHSSGQTVIKIQKAITKDERTLSRIVAHEICHAWAYWKCYSVREYVSDKAYGHSTTSAWYEAAQIINRREGDNTFITEKSDETYVETQEKSFYVYLEYGATGIWWAWFARVDDNLRRNLLFRIRKCHSLGGLCTVAKTNDTRFLLSGAKLPDTKRLVKMPEDMVQKIQDAIKANPIQGEESDVGQIISRAKIASKVYTKPKAANLTLNIALTLKNKLKSPITTILTDRFNKLYPEAWIGVTFTDDQVTDGEYTVFGSAEEAVEYWHKKLDESEWLQDHNYKTAIVKIKPVTSNNIWQVASKSGHLGQPSILAKRWLDSSAHDIFEKVYPYTFSVKIDWLDKVPKKVEGVWLYEAEVFDQEEVGVTKEWTSKDQYPSWEKAIMGNLKTVNDKSSILLVKEGTAQEQTTGVYSGEIEEMYPYTISTVPKWLDEAPPSFKKGSSDGSEGQDDSEFDSKTGGTTSIKQLLTQVKSPGLSKLYEKVRTTKPDILVIGFGNDLRGRSRILRGDELWAFGPRSAFKIWQDPQWQDPQELNYNVAVVRVGPGDEYKYTYDYKGLPCFYFKGNPDTEILFEGTLERYFNQTKTAGNIHDVDLALTKIKSPGLLSLRKKLEKLPDILVIGFGGSPYGLDRVEDGESLVGFGPNSAKKLKGFGSNIVIVAMSEGDEIHRYGSYLGVPKFRFKGNKNTKILFSGTLHEYTALPKDKQVIGEWPMDN